MVELTIEDAIATDMRRRADGERGDPGPLYGEEKPYFIQMKGRARVSGRLSGARVAGEGTGFFETYR
jgi:hypothetical protein